MKKLKLKTIICWVAIIALVGYYLYYENNFLEIPHYTIEADNIPSEFDGFKIAQVSDFHNTTSKVLTNQTVNSLTQEQPDIIVITGDLIDSRKTNIDVAGSFVEKIVDIAPIYYVTGNHEGTVSSTEYSELEKALKALGVKVLKNEKLLLKRAGASVEIIGLNDPTFNFNNKNTDYYMNELTSENDSFKILLAHRPERFDTYTDYGIDLVFSGHAHGGQIRIPFIGGLIAPNQGFFPKYTQGVYESCDTKMIVSRGVGNSLFPFRVNNRPQLVVAELKA